MGYRLTVGMVVIALGAFVGLLVYYAPLDGGRSLDFLLTPGAIEAALAAWDGDDIARHRFGTRVLDGGFPLLYTSVILLVLWRYHRGAVFWGFGALVVLGCGVDYAENASNLRLLAGADEAVTHVVLTWVKFALLLPPVGYGLVRLWQEGRKGAEHTGP